MRPWLVAGLAAGTLALPAAAWASPPDQQRFPVSGELELADLSAVCGTTVTLAIEGQFDVKTFYDRTGTLVREIDTQPGTKLTYSSASGSITQPFSGATIFSYPEGAVIGAPATFVETGNFFGGGSGRIVYEGTIADVEDGVPLVSVSDSTVVSQTGDLAGQIERICTALS